MMTPVKRKIIVTSFFTALLLLAAACATPPQGAYYQPVGTPMPAATAAFVATQAAQQGLSAVSTVDAATRFHVETVSAQASATQAAEAATANAATVVAQQTAAAATATIEAIDIAAYAAQKQFELRATEQSFNVTMTAAANEAQTANELAAAEVTRQHALNQAAQIELERERDRNNFLRLLPWVIISLVALIIALVFLFFFHRDQPVDARLPNGMRVSTFWTPEGRRPVVLPPQSVLALPANVPHDSRQGTAVPAVARSGNGTAIVVRPPGTIYVPGQREPVLLPASLPPGKIGVGVTPDKALWYTIDELKDTLIAGTKGSGKSTFLKMLAYQAVMQKCELFLIDAELLTFDPAAWGPVAQSAGEVVDLLQFILYEVIENRFTLYREASALMREAYASGQVARPFEVEDIAAYNKAARMFNLQLLAPAFLFWDEATSHLGDSQVQMLFHDFVRRSRKPGFRVFVAGHTWHAKYVPTPIRGRLEGRYAFRTDVEGSKVVLNGSVAAASIPKEWKGHAITLRDEDGRPGRIQGYYLEPRRLFDDIDPYRKNSPDHVWEIPARTGGRRPAAEDAVPPINPFADDEVIADAQAVLDAGGGERFPSRNSVATFLTDGLDNDYAQTRARKALFYLYLSGHEWAGLRLGNHLDNMLAEAGMVSA